MFRKFLLAAAMTCIATGAAGADGEASSSSYTIGITGFVPVICRASLDATIVPAASGETQLGALNEFCNNPNGYRIFVRGSSELAGATLIVDGQPVTLAGDAPRRTALAARSLSRSSRSNDYSALQSDGDGSVTCGATVTVSISL
jgi:hypothetical protein